MNRTTTVARGAYAAFRLVLLGAAYAVLAATAVWVLFAIVAAQYSA